MNQKEKMSLGIDDEVTWLDPDSGIPTGVYTIRDILTENKRIEDMNTVLIIENDAGSVAEVYLCELT